jgi:hypothetical protein
MIRKKGSTIGYWIVEHRCFLTLFLQVTYSNFIIMETNLTHHGGFSFYLVILHGAREIWMIVRHTIHPTSKTRLARLETDRSFYPRGEARSPSSNLEELMAHFLLQQQSRGAPAITSDAEKNLSQVWKGTIDVLL